MLPTSTLIGLELLVHSMSAPFHMFFFFLRGCRHYLRQAIALQNPKSLDAYISATVMVADLAGEPPSNPQKRSDKVDRPHKPSTPSTPLVVCTHCKKPGHTVDRCFGMHPELRKIKKKS